VIDVSDGPEELTVNVTALLVPAAVVTFTLCAPGVAPLAIANVAFTVVAVELTPVMVMPGITLIVAPLRLVPFSVTPNAALPATPPLGEIEVRAGPGGLIVNVTALLVPPAVVTVTFCGPVAAPLAMANVAVTAVAVELTPVMVMPGIAFIAAPLRLEPFSVTPNPTLPATPLLGEIDVNDGALADPLTIAMAPMMAGKGPLTLEILIAICPPVTVAGKVF
jgi:hypothetical protein